MLITGIPSSQIVNKIAKSNKDYRVDFINTDSNSDQYQLSLYLRHFDQDGQSNYKIRLLLVGNIMSYPAFEMIWTIKDYELASRAFHRICDEVDDVKMHFDKSMMPVSTLAASIREAVKPIAQKYQEKAHIPLFDESGKEAGVSDWRMSIYSGHYPNMSKEEKNRIKKFDGNQIEHSPIYKVAPPRRQK